MRKKDILAAILIRSGMATIIHKVRQLFKQELPVLAYHRILDVSDATKYPYDIEVVDASINEFDEQMGFIKKNYNPISIKDLNEYIDNQKPLPKNPIIITFDDGFEDNYHNAYPILKKHNIQACIFISTGYINSNTPFWFERLSRLILTTKSVDFSIPEINFHTALPNSIQERRKIYGHCVEKLKYIGKENNTKIIETLEKKYYSPSEKMAEKHQKLSNPLSWQQCKLMSDTFTIGSHGTSHTILTQLKEDELDEELADSKSAIEKNIKTQVSSLSFPNGQKPDFNEKLIEKLKQHGYSIYFSYLHGTNKQKDIGKVALKRLHIPTKSLARFKLALAMPEIF